MTGACACRGQDLQLKPVLTHDRRYQEVLVSTERCLRVAAEKAVTAGGGRHGQPALVHDSRV